MRKLAVDAFARLTVGAIKIRTLSIINTRERVTICIFD